MQTIGTSGDFAKSERINLRVDGFTKEMLEQAAVINHRSLTNFIIECAKIQAEQILEREKTIRLSKRDWDKFIRVVANPPKPNAALKRAAKNYRAMKIKSDV